MSVSWFMNEVRWYTISSTSHLAFDDSREFALRSIDIFDSDARACVELSLGIPLERLGLRFACAVASLGIAALAVSTFVRRGPMNPKGESAVRQRLLAAVGASHFAGVRLAGLKLPARTELRGSVAEQREVAREIEASARKNPTPRALGELGLLQLATGRFDAAVQLLERSTRRAPSDAGLRMDLDAAYLARGRALERPRDIVRALDRIGSSPIVLDSIFNRALALQSLYLNRLAKSAWAQYLERDRDSAWGQIAAEYWHTLAAGERLPDHVTAGSPRTGIIDSILKPPGQSAQTEELQNWIEEQGLGAWASAVLAREAADRRAAEQLLRQAAARLSDLSGDRLATDEVEILAAAPADRSRLLAKGLRDYAQARIWLDRYNHEKSLAFFERAAERFRLASSPRLWWAEAGIAQCEMQLEHYHIARRKAEQILVVARRQSYVAIEARCDWVLAGIGLGTLDLNLARRNAVACHTIHQRAGNRTGAATASLLLGRIDDELGNSAAAWLHRLRGFRDLAKDGKDERLALAIGNASFALARESEFRAAADFASESLAFDRQQGTPVGLAESLWMRAMHRAKGGDAEGALADVREAKTHLAAIDSADIRERIRAGLHAVEGALRSESQPQIALEHLDAALGFLRLSGYEYGQAEILIDRARTLRRLGRSKDALTDLDRAARIVATQRARLQEPSLRVSFFNLQAELADERVAANVRFDPRGERAFWVADQARGLLFRDSLGLASGPIALVQPTARLSNQIGEDDAVLSYWSLPDSLLIWIVRHNTPPRLIRQAISRDQLRQRISDFILAVEEGAEPTKLSPLARQLGQTLIAPVAPELRGVRRLIVVPDRIVRAVPWSALELDSGQGPLLHRFLIRISPAAATLGGPEKRARRSMEEPSHVRLMAIGAPEVALSEESAYVSLPGARREIDGIACLFSDPVVLTGVDATRTRLLAGLGRTSIIHIASHFTVGREPGSSRIVLAGSGDGDAERGLDTETIARLSLPHLRLAVLSGCATNREAEPSLEGTFAAAGSFLAAGASETVATLWPVDDHFTAELMTRFYRELLDGYETDEALHRAQLALLENSQSAARKPVHWAAFQVISLRSHGTGMNFGKEKQ